MAVLTCPECATPFTPDQVNVALGLASCGPCGKVHDLSTRRGPRIRTVPADATGMVEREGPEPALTWSWRGWQLLFLIVWCTFWDLGLLVMVTAALAEGQWEVLAFCSLHGAVGLGVTYLTAALLVNHTELALTPDALVIGHGPLPWWGGQSLARDGLRQIWVEERVSSKGARSYLVHAEVSFGPPVKLVSGLSAGRARFVEEWIERRLGIVDAPVAGEHGSRTLVGS